MMPLGVLIWTQLLEENTENIKMNRDIFKREPTHVIMGVRFDDGSEVFTYRSLDDPNKPGGVTFAPGHVIQEPFS